MSVEKVLKTWLYQYACKHRYNEVLQLLKGEYCNNDTPQVWLAIATVHSVVDKMDTSAFHSVLSIIQDLFDAYQHIITYREFAKVTTGLKTLALFDHLQGNQKLALPKLNEYFPRNGVTHPAADENLSVKLTKAQQEFRKFFLSLIASEKQRSKYMAQDYHKEFGDDFKSRLRHLTKQFLKKITATLPPTVIEKILQDIQQGTTSSNKLSHKLSQLNHPSVELFLDTLYVSSQNDNKLSESDIKDILKSFDNMDSGQVSYIRQQGLGIAAVLHNDSTT